MTYSFEINNPDCKWAVTLLGPIPTDEQGWQRVRRSEVKLRDVLEKLTSEPREVAAARMKKLTEKVEQITFLDLLDESVKKTEAVTSDSQFLEIIYDLASEYSPWVVAKYVGLPDDFVESLSPSNELLAEIDQMTYGMLARSIEPEYAQSKAFGSLIQEIFKGRSNHQGWLHQAEKLFAAYLEELKAKTSVEVDPTLIAPVFGDIKKIKVGFKEAVIVFSPMLFTDKANAWNRIRSKICSNDDYLRLIKVAIWGLSGSLTDDLFKLCDRFSNSARNDEYYSYRGNFTGRLENRIAKEQVFFETVNKSEDRLIYALRRGGYKTKEIRDYIIALTGKQATNDIIRQRYKRTKDKLQKKWSDEVSQSSS